MSGILLEVCVEDAEGLAAAVAGGADRIELCSALCLGGLTPSTGLMSLAAAAPVPVYAMIRPRAGDFVYSDTELDVMAHDIESARRSGMAGIVLGAARKDGRLDEKALSRLKDVSTGLGTTLHRVFDLVPEQAEAIEMAVKLGFERILTSGGARNAIDGIDALEEAVAKAAGRISIMPGGGISYRMVAALLPRLPVREIHASCSVAEPISDETLISFGFSPPQQRRTSEELVRRLKERISFLV